MWTEYVIDATMGIRDGLLCFCPVERATNGEVENIVTGMNYLSDAPPNDGKLIGVVHADGQPAVEAWCEANKALLDRLFARDRDGAEGGDANAAPVPQDRQARAEGIAQNGGDHA